jgi:hypothetical protein
MGLFGANILALILTWASYESAKEWRRGGISGKMSRIFCAIRIALHLQQRFGRADVRNGKYADLGMVNS